MIKKIFGGLMLLMGVALLGWVVFAIVTGQPEVEKRSPLPALLFAGALIGVGAKWAAFES